MRTRNYLLSTTFAVTFLLLPAALPAQAQSALTGVGDVRRGRRDGRRRRQRQEGRLDHHRQRRHRRAGPLRVPGRHGSSPATTR